MSESSDIARLAVNAARAPVEVDAEDFWSAMRDERVKRLHDEADRYVGADVDEAPRAQSDV